MKLDVVGPICYEDAVIRDGMVYVKVGGVWYRGTWDYSQWEKVDALPPLQMKNPEVSE